MSGLSTALNTALSGLNVNQQALAVLSNNIANANTPGYSRQVANEQPVYLDGQGAGVSVEDVTRQVNVNLVTAVQQQNSAVGQTGVLTDYNSRIQLLLGQPGSDNSLSTYVGSFFNDLQSLAQTPQNTALQQAAVNSGVTVAGQIQSLAQGLQNLQYQADSDIGTGVTNVNTDLINLAQVNQSIGDGNLQNQSVAGLQDQQQSLINDISQYMNIQTYTQSNGMVSVTAGNGTTLVDGTIPYHVSYTPATSAEVFANNASSLSPLEVYRTDAAGNPVGAPSQLVSGGSPSQITSTLSSGKIAGLLSMRDQQIPDIMSQLDTFAANLRDQVNSIENSGTGFPGANSFTGTRAVNAQSSSQWAGSVQIAVLNSNGQPVASPYPDETNGLAPLTLNLSTLNTGQGAGQPSVQGIVNAINQYYGTPQNKVELGNLNNIQLASDSASLPGTAGQFNFDLNLSNLSASASNVYVTGVSVQPSTGSNTSSVTSPVDISVNSYTTTASSTAVTVNTAGSTAGLKNGEQVYLSGPGTTVDGISAGNLTGFFTISYVTGNSFQITANSAAQSGATTNPVGAATVTPPYADMPAGQSGRTSGNGLFNVSFGSNSSAPYYTVTLNVAVDDGSGNPPKTSQITYQVTNGQASALNNLYSAQTANNDGTIVKPNTSQPIAQALLVDANGNELPKDSSGNYTTTENGYLEIKANGSSNVVAINSATSAQQGQPNNTPPIPGSNQGFSQYFNLNNFFQSNNPTATGDSVAGSAANLQVVQSLQNDPGLISLGTLTQNTLASSNSSPNYTYVRNPGDNSVIQQLASLSTATINFPTAGTLGANTQSFGGYAAAIIGAASSNATTATTAQTNAQTLLTGYQQQASTFSGVNLTTELANTVIYQNAYSASARVITVVSGLFNTLLSSVTPA